jgi:hypothetical protein
MPLTGWGLHHFVRKFPRVQLQARPICAAHIGMDGMRIEKEPRQETNM